jgi:probable rRNA maturation factor
MVNIVVNTDPRYPVNKLAIQATISDVLSRHSIGGNVEIGVSIIGDRKMHQINKQYRGIDSSTNILSFALEDPVSVNDLQHVPRVGFVKSPDRVLYLGDMLISWPELLRDAAEEGVAVEDQLRFLVEHGTKHLLGMHHD